MKTLLVVVAVTTLSATGAFSQGVDFSLGAPGVPPVSYTDGSSAVLPGQGHLAAQQVRRHHYRITTQRVGGYAKIARRKVW